MDLNDTFIISSHCGDINIKENYSSHKIRIRFQNGGNVTFGKCVLVHGEEGPVQISLPVGSYKTLSFRDVKGNINIDLPNSHFNDLHVSDVVGDIEGKLHYQNVRIQGLNGNNFINKKHIVRVNTSRKPIIDRMNSESENDDENWEW